MTGIRLHTFWNILRNYVLEAIQTRPVSNFGAFYYMFIVNVGLYKDPEFAPIKIHPKLKQKHAFYLENTKIVLSVCTEVLFVLDSMKTQVKRISHSNQCIFCSSSYRIQRQIVGYACPKTKREIIHKLTGVYDTTRGKPNDQLFARQVVTQLSKIY